MIHVADYHFISLTVIVHVKDTGEVRSDHRRFEGRRCVIPFLEYYGNNVISNVSLSLHLPERGQRKQDEEKLHLCDSRVTGIGFKPGFIVS